MKNIKSACWSGLVLVFVQVALMTSVLGQEHFYSPNPQGDPRSQLGYEGHSQIAQASYDWVDPSASLVGYAGNYGLYDHAHATDARAPRLLEVYAGYSFSFTKLHMKESFEAYVLDFSTFTQTLVPFEYDYELTPRVWLGARAENGLGFRTSYWNYDHQSNGFQFTNATGFQVPVATSTSVIFPAAIVGDGFGDSLTVNSAVKASTLDFEGTYQTGLGAIQVDVGGGVRYARSHQRSEAVKTPGPLNPFSQPATLTWERIFEGIGPSFSANGSLPIGNRGFYCVGGANLSFLFGEKSLRRTVVNDATPVPNTGLPILLFEQADEISGVYGVRIGLGHKQRTSFGTAHLEGTYEGQLWTDMGAPTMTFAGFNSFNVNLGLGF